jgi:hypothetical protein
LQRHADLPPALRGAFNNKLRSELADWEVLPHRDELQYVVDHWRMDYPHYRPHSSLEYMSPAALSASCVEPDSATLRQSQHSDAPGNHLIEAGI